MNNDHERRFLAARAGLVLDSEDRSDGESGGLSGYAAVYYDGSPATEFKLWDGAVERIMPGAFDRALREEDDVRALFNHDPSQLLGRSSAGTLELESLSDGLRYRISPADTTISKDVREHVRAGNLTGSSFSFRVTDEEWIKDGDAEIRLVSGVELFDVGPVTFPAYQSTTVAARSSCDTWTEGRRRVDDEAARRYRERELDIIENS